MSVRTFELCSVSLMQTSVCIIPKMEVNFKTNVASRGWHFYGKTVWSNPVKGEKLFAKKEEDKNALLVDPYAIAWMRKSKAKLVADVVGHIPQEISRFVYFFLQHGGSVEGVVHNEKYRPSPIPKGGLEIILVATFKIEYTKGQYLTRMKELVEKNYDLTLEGIDKDNGQSEDDDDDDCIMLFEDTETLL